MSWIKLSLLSAQSSIHLTTCPSVYLSACLPVCCLPACLPTTHLPACLCLSSHPKLLWNNIQSPIGTKHYTHKSRGIAFVLADATSLFMWQCITLWRRYYCGLWNDSLHHNWGAGNGWTVCCCHQSSWRKSKRFHHNSQYTRWHSRYVSTQDIAGYIHGYFIV